MERRVSDAVDALEYMVFGLRNKPPKVLENGTLEGEYLPPRPADFLKKQPDGVWVGRITWDTLKKVGES